MKKGILIFITILFVAYTLPNIAKAESRECDLLPVDCSIHPIGRVLIRTNPLFDSDETTVEGWFKPYSYPTGVFEDEYRSIIWNGDGTGGHDPYWFYINIDGYFVVRVHYNDPYKEEFLSSENPIGLNVWHHFALVVSANETKLCLDGKLQPTIISGAGPLCKGTNYLAFGRSLWHWNTFDGLLDEIRIWSVARSEQQIRSSKWAGAITGNEYGLTAYWDFEPGDAPGVLYDLSPNKLNGDLKGLRLSTENAPSFPTAVSGCMKYYGESYEGIEVQLNKKGGKKQITTFDADGCFNFSELSHQNNKFDIKIKWPEF